MITELPGAKEDLIQRCPECEYCIFEQILLEEDRKVKVLERPIPKNHMHRITIEEICGKNYDGVCYMKYAAMRSMYGDFMAAQMGAVKDFLWDLGKKRHRKVDYEEGMKEWTKNQNFGRGKFESYAERFRNVWNSGIRRGKDGEERQNLTSTSIYEIIVSSFYGIAIEILKKLKDEFEERDAL